MNNQFTKTFSPTNDQGGLDCRFQEDLRIIFQSISTDIIEGLTKFHNQTSELEKNYAGYARKLCEAFFKRIKYLDDHERDSSNQHRWKTKMLKANLREGLKEIGFKPSKVTKLIGAAEFISSVHERHPLRKEIEALPIGSQYALSRMSDEGFHLATIQSPFDGEDWNPTRDELDRIAAAHPKREWKRKPQLKPSIDIDVVPDDTPSLTEIVIEGKSEPTQYELAKELVAIASLIETKDGWKDPELIEILSQEANQLMSLAHIAMEPVTQPITV